MKLSYILLCGAVVAATAAWATSEKVIVKTQNGTQKFEITSTTAGSFSTENGVESLIIDGNPVAAVSDILSVGFVDEAQLPFTVTDGNGHVVAGYDAVPSMLRVNPAEAGQPTVFAFGTVEAAEAADLPAGEYGIYLSMSASALNAGGITDLAADAQSYALKLYKYEEGQAVDSLTNTTAGHVTYTWNPRAHRLTLDIEATFSDGTVLKAPYTGTPVDVTSVSEMVPAKTYSNEMVVVNATGDGSMSYAIESVRKTALSSYNSHAPGFKFAFNSPTFYGSKFEVEVNAENIIDKGDLNMANMGGEYFYVRFGDVQLYPAYSSTDGSYPYKNHVDNGTIRVTQLSDTEYEIFIDFINSYSNYMGEGQGTKEHFTLHWRGPVE